jgi:hypothetical protein
LPDGQHLATQNLLQRMRPKGATGDCDQHIESGGEDKTAFWHGVLPVKCVYCWTKRPVSVAIVKQDEKNGRNNSGHFLSSFFADFFTQKPV